MTPPPLSEQAERRLLAMAAAIGEPTPPPALPPRYDILRELGRGGMGVVYEVFDRELGRRVALKTLPAGADDELRRRLQREGLAVARLQHPHIAAVYEATPQFLTMQCIDGGPLPLLGPSAAEADRRRLVALVKDAALALQHAHAQGVVHRDLKPSNLLVERDHVYVVDFGLAKAIDPQQSLSVPGGLVGTPAFLPPEQALGRSGDVDARSDVYGLGATLYCCMAGSPPFASDDLPTLLRNVVERAAPMLPGDRDLALIVATCLRKEREHRYQTAADLAADLERWLRHEPIAARPPALGYRLRKAWRRQRTLWRAAGAAAAAAATLAAVVLVPSLLHQRAARQAAGEAVALADRVATVGADVAMFQRLGDHAAAHALLDATIAQVRAFLARHEVARARYLLGRLLRARGQPEAALAELERTLVTDPELADARFERGLLLAALPQADEAQRAQAIGDLRTPLGPDTVVGNTDRLFGRAELSRLCSAGAEAEAMLREVLEYEPSHVGARQALAMLARQAGQADLARYYAASAIDMQRGYGPLYFARERQLLPTTMLGLDGALVDFSDELREGPDNALALAHRGLVQLRRALRLWSEGDARAALLAADAAVEDHVATLHVHPALAGAYNNRAVCWLVVDELQVACGDSAAAAAARNQAEADLLRASESMRDACPVQHNLGLAALRSAQALAAMGRSAASRQRAEAAVAALQRGIAAAPPDWPLATTARKKLVLAQALSGS